MPAASRESDERILRWLRLNRAGWTWAQIALASGPGLTRNAVLTACNGVRRADVAESGEPEAKVRAAYGPNPTARGCARTSLVDSPGAAASGAFSEALHASR